MRARLSWISRATGSYLFTDRTGVKVSDSSVHGLAVELRRGSARVIENAPVLDRTLSHLTQSLRDRLGRSG